MAFATVTLTGTYQVFDTTPATGFVRIEPTVPLVTDTVGNVVLAGPTEIILGTSGDFTVNLPATDDERLNPTGFLYTVTALLDNGKIAPVSFELPAASVAVDMADVTPASSVPEFVSLVTRAEFDALSAQVDDLNLGGGGNLFRVDFADARAELTAVTGSLRFYPRITGAITGVTISLAEYGSGSVVVDVNVADSDGDPVTIFTDQAHRPTLIRDGFADAPVIDAGDFNDDQCITVDVDDPGAGNSKLLVTVFYRGT